MLGRTCSGGKGTGFGGTGGELLELSYGFDDAAPYPLTEDWPHWFGPATASTFGSSQLQNERAKGSGRRPGRCGC